MGKTRKATWCNFANVLSNYSVNRTLARYAGSRRLPRALGNVSVHTARDRALDFLTHRYRDGLELVPTDRLHVPAYGFDPTGWDLFVVSNRNEALMLRGDEYVAVHRTTGEVRYLGILGD